MPLIKYSGFVGSALFLSLVGLGWCFSQSRSEPPRPPSDVSDRPAVGTASAEQLPERITIDTNLSAVVSPPNELEFAERWPQATVAVVEPVPKPATPMAVSDVPAKQKIAKRERPKKVAVRREEPKANIETARDEKMPPSPAVTRSSLLDILTEGVEQTHAKLMAGLEPLTAYVSKPRPETR